MHALQTMETEVKEVSNLILVKNVPAAAHKEYLELLFEKIGEESVTKVDKDEENHTAVIQFQSESAVHRVLKRGKIDILGQTVEIEEFAPKPICSVRVFGPRSIVCEQTLEFLKYYFESPRNNGGLVKSISYNSESAFVCVTFESEDDARRVATKDHVINKNQVKVVLQTSENAGLSEGPKEEEQKTVVVRGIQDSQSRESIQYYFENTRRSGGGQVEAFNFDEENKSVEITFQDSETAKDVAARGNHILCGHALHVCLQKKNRTLYSDRVLIQGLNPDTTPDCLGYFMEAMLGVKPSQLAYHKDRNDIVMVKMESQIDFAKLNDSGKTSSIDGASVTFTQVSVSNSIIIEGLTPSIMKDVLELYFENQKRSGGGQVEKIVMIDGQTAILYFVDHNVIQDVLRSTHKLNESELRVKRFLECLDLPEDDTLVVQNLDPLTISDIDSAKLEFIKTSNTYRMLIEEKLRTENAEIKWLYDKNKVIIRYTGVKSSFACNKYTRNWSLSTQKTFMNLLTNIHKQSVQVKSKKIESALTTNVSNKLMVSRKEKDRIVELVGDATNVHTLTAMLHTLSEEEEEITDISITVCHESEMKMLKALNLVDKVRDSAPNVSVVMERSQVIFKGTRADLLNAQLVMYDLQNRFTNFVSGELPVLNVNLYLEKETISFIDENLKSKNKLIFWNVAERRIVACCSKDNSVFTGLDLILSAICYERLDIFKDDTTVGLLRNVTAECKLMYNKKVSFLINEDGRFIEICATNDIFDKVFSTITEVQNAEKIRLEKDDPSLSSDAVTLDPVNLRPMARKVDQGTLTDCYGFREPVVRRLQANSVDQCTTMGSNVLLEPAILPMEKTEKPYKITFEPVDSKCRNVNTKRLYSKEFQRKHLRTYSPRQPYSGNDSKDRNDAMYENIGGATYKMGVEDERCKICLDDICSPKKLWWCGHTFCTECIEQQFQYKQWCPICLTVEPLSPYKKTDNKSALVRLRKKEEQVAVADIDEEKEENKDCVICMDRLDMPVKLSCGHKFCLFCMQSMVAHNHTTSCPICMYSDRPVNQIK